MDEATQGTEPRCPSCALTLTELNTVGLMGCPACYKTFARQVKRAVEVLHGVAPAEEKNPWPTRRATPNRP